MWIKIVVVTICALGLGACVATPVAPLPAQLLWHDQAFYYNASLVTLGKQDLFALDPNLLSVLRKARLEKASAQTRVDYLISLLFDPKNNSTITEFPYEAGHTTIASETWRRKRGDCLSLVVLSYALAKTMNLPAKIQEVRVPYIFDRQGGIDYVAGHVNLLIKNGGRLQLVEGFGIGDVIIDFEPQIGSRREGPALSEDAILARFYNNLAVEFLAKGKQHQAYAHFKAAIETDATFAPSYANLALLYKREGLTQSAENLLLHAIALNDEDDFAMSSLHQLLSAQGRTNEAVTYAKLLDVRREKNPYYWIGLGLDQLRKGHYKQAIYSLEQAQARSTGFVEVHRYLAIAYARDGNQTEAKKQVSLLADLTNGDTSDAALNKKLKKLQHN